MTRAKPWRANSCNTLPWVTFTACHDRRQNNNARLLRQRQQLIADLLDGLRRYFAAALNAVGCPTRAKSRRRKS